MLVGVEVIEIVALFAELNTLSSIAKLLHEKRVVFLHDLPYQLPWYCRHFPNFSLHPQNLFIYSFYLTRCKLLCVYIYTNGERESKSKEIIRNGRLTNGGLSFSRVFASTALSEILESEGCCCTKLNYIIYYQLRNPRYDPLG